MGILLPVVSRTSDGLYRIGVQNVDIETRLVARSGSNYGTWYHLTYVLEEPSVMALIDGLQTTRLARTYYYRRRNEIHGPFTCSC